ncbi:MAG: hypothetical protein GEV12_13340 [Micromonosporaceae bacterium]|nr:hypothetical protein [Micromonosporaceae bacterium]
MNVSLQIRDVPGEVRDAIAALAAANGQSMQGYLLELVRREARVARNRTLFDRLAGKRVRGLVVDDIVTTIRRGRDDPDRADPDVA